MIKGPVRFGNFIILYRLGVGGMGEVYRAVKVGPGGFEKDVALKVIHPDFSGDPEFRKMFLREARVAAKIQHPNVVSVFELGTYGETLYMCMELVKGVTLRRLINALWERKECFSEDEVAYMVYYTALGLKAVHSLEDTTGEFQRIIHRDISPQNIFITFSGDVKLSDFGVAKIYGYSEVTRTEVVKGKPSYMSPEQLRGEVVDERSDLYSLGIVAAELLTGRKVFSAVEFTAGGVLRKFDESVFEEVGRFGDVLRMLLEEDREKRMRSAGELAAVLNETFDIRKGEEKVKEKVKRLFSEERRRQELREREIFRSRVFSRIKSDILREEGGESTLIRGKKRKSSVLYVMSGAVAALLVSGFTLLFTRELRLEEVKLFRKGAVEKVQVKEVKKGDVLKREKDKRFKDLKFRKVKKRRRSLKGKEKKSKKEDMHSGQSYLSVFSNVPGYVFIDGKSTGRKTPLKKYAISPGEHTIVLLHPEMGLVGMERMRFERGKTHVIRFRSRKSKSGQ